MIRAPDQSIMEKLTFDNFIVSSIFGIVLTVSYIVISGMGA